MSRLSLLSLPERRAWWLALLARAEAAGAAAQDGEPPARQAVFELTGLVVRAPQVNFPLPFASAGAASGGFLQLARGFVTAGQPEALAPLGAALAAAARCCRGLIEIEDAKAAEAFQAAQARRLGEGD
jgi:hypothetical protein